MIYDFCGALISLLSTYYYIRLDLKAWPVGLLATALNGWLYWQKGIYADSALELFYAVFLCYGWHQWLTIAPKAPTKTHHLLNQPWLSISIAIIALYTVIVSLLMGFTHSKIATLDALTTSLSLVAQWLMCHKMIATWCLWFIADALYALMYLYKDLPFHSALMILYTGLALTGYLHWQTRFKRFNSSLNPIPDGPKA
jgi:nicotinamide mononucleotide transporter